MQSTHEQKPIATSTALFLSLGRRTTRKQSANTLKKPKQWLIKHTPSFGKSADIANRRMFPTASFLFLTCHPTVSRHNQHTYISMKYHASRFFDKYGTTQDCRYFSTKTEAIKWVKNSLFYRITCIKGDRKIIETNY